MLLCCSSRDGRLAVLAWNKELFIEGEVFIIVKEGSNVHKYTHTEEFKY